MTKHSDQLIDSTLRALGEAAPPRGIEDRIIRTLARHTAPSRPVFFAVASSRPLRLALAFSALCVAVVSARMHFSAAAPQALPAPSLRVPHVRDSLSAADVAARSARHSVRPRSLSSYEAASFTSPSTPAMEPASYPAPEAPLTEEEKLLARIAYRQGASLTAQAKEGSESITSVEPLVDALFIGFQQPQPSPETQETSNDLPSLRP